MEDDHTSMADKTTTIAKLELPEGTQVDSILIVTYPWSRNIIPGDYDGRVSKIAAQRVTVHFTYKPSDDPPCETVTINLKTGMDETFDAPVSGLRLAGPAATMNE